MPRILNLRLLNIKIVYYDERLRNYTVFNLHNSSKRTFSTIERFINYHSPNTKFIDFNSSRIINVPESLNRSVIYLTEKIVCYKQRIVNSTENKYYNINSKKLTDAQVISLSDDIYYLSSISYDTLMRIQMRIHNIALNYFTPSYNAMRLELLNNSYREITGHTYDPGLRATTITSIDLNEAINAVNTVRDTSENINTNLIYPYHGGPRNIVFHKNENDSNDEKKFFGIELEIDASKDRNASSTKKHRLARRIHQLMNDGNYNSLLKFETDASIGQYGFEIITQPMTMKYILTDYKEKFKEMMMLIEQENYSSHDSGRCGMHIHVSRNALTPEMIDNSYLIFENFKNEIIAFSRRTENTMNWCRFITDHYNNCPDTITDEYIKSHKPSGNSHGSAINNGNSNTVEFRIFRGTTKLRTFIANIQLIDNMIELSKKEDITGLTWNQIINYNDEYTELISYNEKRGIVSKHELSKNINKIEIISRPVILVRPFQMRLEGDN